MKKAFSPSHHMLVETNKAFGIYYYLSTFPALQERESSCKWQMVMW